MIAMDVPEDIRKQAQDIVQQLGTDIPRGLMAHAIAQALLFERLAQRERDAKIAEGNDHFPEEGDYIAGLVRQS